MPRGEMCRCDERQCDWCLALGAAATALIERLGPQAIGSGLATAALTAALPHLREAVSRA